MAAFNYTYTLHNICYTLKYNCSNKIMHSEIFHIKTILVSHGGD